MSEAIKIITNIKLDLISPKSVSGLELMRETISKIDPIILHSNK